MINLELEGGQYHGGINLAIYPQGYYQELRKGSVVNLVNRNRKLLGKAKITAIKRQDYAYVTDDELKLYHVSATRGVNRRLYNYYGDAFLFSVNVTFIFFTGMDERLGQ